MLPSPAQRWPAPLVCVNMSYGTPQKIFKIRKIKLMTECIYLLKLEESIVQRVRGRHGAGQHCWGFISLSQHLRIDKIPNMCPICFHSNCPHLCRALIGRASITRPLVLASDWSAQLTGARRPPQVTAPAGRRQRFSLPRRVGTRGCVSFIHLQRTVLHPALKWM